MKLLAKALSYIFHPLLLPTYGFLLINWINPYLLAGFGDGSGIRILMMVVLNTFIYPLIFVLLMIALKFLDSIQMPDQKQRHLPYIATSIFFMWNFMVFNRQQLPELMTAVFLGATIAVFACFFINIFFKISMHTAGMGAMVALVFGLAYQMDINLVWVTIGTILIAGLVGTSRLRISTHDPVEVYSGYVVGAFCQLAAFYFIF